MNKIGDTTTRKQNITYTVPSVLTNYNANERFPTFTLRQGGFTQVEATITTEFYDEPVENKEPLFLIKATNQINVGRFIVNVLNDKIEGDKPIAPSSPTASQYMENIGSTVLISFSCTRSESHSREEEKDVFKVVRSTITLP